MLRKIIRFLLPPEVRARCRWLLINVKPWLQSFPHDILKLKTNGLAIPGPILRSRVGLNCSRRDYFETGNRLSECILNSLHSVGYKESKKRHWLDFGCGCGRVATHILHLTDPSNYTGLDNDNDSITWCNNNLFGDYYVCQNDPPTLLKEQSMDIAFSISVFSHFSEDQQNIWLKELWRVLKPGGILIASTHSCKLTFERPDLTQNQHQELNEKGFLFASGDDRFNAGSTFHSRQYLENNWSQLFDLLLFEEHGMAEYQDLAIWRKRKN